MTAHLWVLRLETATQFIYMLAMFAYWYPKEGDA